MGIRVVLAEDSYLLREGLAQLLARRPEIEVVGSCGSLPELLALVEEASPEVVLTDIRMPPTHTDEGVRAAAELRRSHPGLGVVVLSQYASPGYALTLLRDGAEGRGYLLKDRVDDVDELASALQAVARGGSVIDAKVVDALVAARGTTTGSRLGTLTPRELEVLEQMAQGKSNVAIAAAVYLSPRAVEKHINALFAKLGLEEEPDVNRRVKAVLIYLAEG